MGEVITVTLPLVADKNSNLTEITVRKVDIKGVARVAEQDNQCVVYADNMPPFAVALPADTVKNLAFGENMPCYAG